MKNLWLFLFILPFIQSLAQGDERKEQLNTLKSLHASGAENNNNIIYDRIEVNIDPAVNWISGKITTLFIPDGPMPCIEFDLDDTLVVDSIIYHQATAAYTHDSDIVHISFGAPLNTGAVDSICICYHGSPGSTGFGSFVASRHGPDTVPIIWTLSEPYGAKNWWPCKMDLRDKIDSLDMLITTPSQYRAASNGLLAEETSKGAGYTTYHWKHRYPIATYLVCLAVTNYTSFTNYIPYHGDTLTELNYVYPEDSAVSYGMSQLIIPVMQLYDSLFGIYPFQREKYGMAEFGWGGGMEHQTMTFVANFGFELIAHELGHHWFGDKVTLDSWSDIWLNEGFATYLSVISFEHIQPQNLLPILHKHLGRAVSAPNGSVWCDDTSSVGRIFDSNLSYSKGAFVLRMLRWKIGDSAFFGGLRSYLSDINNAYSFSSSASLESHMEAAGSTDLSGFFAQWIYGRGFPQYQISWTQDFSNHVQLTIHQTPTDNSVTFFTMPVPVLFSNGVSDTLITFNNTVNGQTFSFDLPYPVDSVTFDPELRLISANNTIIRVEAYDFSMRVYPNPAQSVVQFQIQTGSSKKAVVRIFDDAGKEVENYNYTLQAGANLLAADVSLWASGNYHVSIQAGKQTLKQSFIVSPRK